LGLGKGHRGSESKKVFSEEIKELKEKSQKTTTPYRREKGNLDE